MTRIACLLCLLTGLINAGTSAVGWASAQQRRMTSCVEEQLAVAKTAVSVAVTFDHGVNAQQ
jgi:hypothetical protein